MKEAWNKGHILYDSIYMKHPGQANPQRLKADGGCHSYGGAGDGEWLLMGTRFLSEMMKVFWNSIVVMVTQLCKYTQNHWIVNKNKYMHMSFKKLVSCKQCLHVWFGGGYFQRATFESPTYRQVQSVTRIIKSTTTTESPNNSFNYITY